MVQGITQIIDAEGGTVQNIADFRIANSINGYLNVEGTVAPVKGSLEPVRVDVKFTAFCLKIGVLPQLKVPLGWSNPTVSLLFLFLIPCHNRVNIQSLGPVASAPVAAICHGRHCVAMICGLWEQS